LLLDVELEKESRWKCWSWSCRRHKMRSPSAFHHAKSRRMAIASTKVRVGNFKKSRQAASIWRSWFSSRCFACIHWVWLSPRKPPVLRDGATPDESLHGFLLFGARRVEVWRLVKCHVQTQISSCSCPSFTSRTGWVIGRWYQVEKMMRLDVGHCQVHPDQVEQQRVESV
jgi:hypothetical protein